MLCFIVFCAIIQFTRWNCFHKREELRLGNHLPFYSILCNHSTQQIERFLKREKSRLWHHSTHHILTFVIVHFLDHRPEPSFEPLNPLVVLATLVVEWRVTDECLHVDVTDTVQQQTQILRCKALEWCRWYDIKHTQSYVLNKYIDYIIFITVNTPNLMFWT